MIRQKSPLKASARVGGRGERWRVAGICLVLAAITFAVFGQTLQYEFVNYDDDHYVYDNPVVARGLTFKGVIWAFTQIQAANWHPLTWLSHMLDCQLYGLHPGGHHLTNVLIHAATVIMLFLVLRQMTGALWRSAFVAAVFAIHPLRAESVAWVAERKDVLSGFFFMLTIGAYVCYVRRSWSWWRYGPVLLLFAMGLMCKPMLVTLPLVLLMLDYWPLRRVGPRKLSGLLLEKLPLLALSCASCVITLIVQHEALHTGETYPLPLRFGNTLATCMIYLGQMIYPVGLALLYPYPLHNLPAWEVALAAMLLAGLSLITWKQRQKRPWLLMGWLWYLVMLLPVVGIVQVGEQSHADRYTYLPQIGIYVALTWMVAEWGAKRRVALGGLMAAVIGALMVCARQQTAYWKDSEVLWNRTLACTTGNNTARLNLGLALLHKDRVGEAIAQYQKALENKTDYAEAHNNLGIALFQEGSIDEAMAHFQKALAIKPDYAEVRYNLGVSFSKLGRLDEAVSQYQKALQLNPNYEDAHIGLGNVLCQMGRVDEAIPHFQKALQINPDNAKAHNSLGNALCQAGRVDEGIIQYQEALQIQPRHGGAHDNLGNALLQKGRVDEAITQFQQALQINPDDATARANLERALKLRPAQTH